MMKASHALALLTLAVLLVFTPARAVDYDPLLITDTKPEQKDFTVKDATRKRDIPIRVYFPKDTAAAPVAFFSHGLGGTREGSAFLGNHWAARGYVAIFIQHPGSDDSVWRDKPAAGRMAAMQQAASPQNFLLRVTDVPVVIDQLEHWNVEDGHALKGRLDLKHVGMSGHSFGAVTTEAVSGQIFPIGKPLTDPRIKAAIIMSPSGPRDAGADMKKSFGQVKIPWLLMTGTNDTAPIGGFDAASRRVVFPALPPGGKYELVLDKAEHSVFTERALPGDSQKRNPNHHRAILALSTAFWDAYLRDDSKAKEWLDSDAARSVLEKDDQWQKK